MSTVERRRSPRFDTRIPGRISLGDGEVLHCEVQDVCRDAALLVVAKGLELDASVVLSVSLPGFLGSFEAAGRVVRVTEPLDVGVGVVVLFGDLTPNAATAIDLFLERLAREGEPQVGPKSA